MILMIDTTREHIGKQFAEELFHSGGNPTEFELIDTTGMRISHCIGCNDCWLKTPGICAIKDDYEPILKKMSIQEFRFFCRAVLRRGASSAAARSFWRSCLGIWMFAMAAVW